MNWKRVTAVLKREYTEHIRRKAFWIMTGLMPLLMLGFAVASIWTQTRVSGVRRIAVIDPTGKYFAALKAEIEQSNDQAAFSLSKRDIRSSSLRLLRAELKKEIDAKTLDGYLILDEETIAKGVVAYRAASVSDLAYQERLERHLNATLQRRRLAERGLPDEAIAQIQQTVSIDARRVDEERGTDFWVAMLFFVVLYTTLIQYGFYNLRGVIEEKSNRIVEIIISSVRPTELMIGKIFGIGLVGLTQYAIWSVLAMNLTPLAGSIVARVLGIKAHALPFIPFPTIAYFALYFVLGYFFYASIYTAIGAPFNSDQEAQQLALIPTFMIASVWAFWGLITNNPNSTAATILSMIPFLTPMVMFFRVTLSPVPAWQIGLSTLIMIASIFGMAWFAGKIYRVGILMYGKKPTIPEIFRWLRHSDREPVAGSARP